MKKLSIFPLAVFLLAASIGFAQEEGEELEQTLSQLSATAATEYVRPFVNTFGTNLNSGWYHTGPKPTKFALSLEVGLVGVGTFIPDDPAMRSFSVDGSFRFTQSQASDIVTNTVGLVLLPADEAELVNTISTQDFDVNIAGATIFAGPNDTISVTYAGGDVTYTPPSTGIPETVTLDPHVITLPIGGIGELLADIKVLPSIAPQASVGTVLGTKAVFRWLPEIAIPGLKLDNELGTIKWFGWGVQHNPGVFFSTPLPVDIALCFYTQNIKIGDIFEADTTSYGLTAFKKLGIPMISLTPYVGFLIERSTMSFAYDFTLDEGTVYEQNISILFDLKGDNTSRIIAGLSVKLLFFDIYADYSFGNYKAVRIGVMFGL